MMTIDNRVPVASIGNLNQLPAQIRYEIKAMKELRAIGFQEILGYQDRTIMCSCGGHWTYATTPTGQRLTCQQHLDTFEVTSYGSHNYQWDGKRLTSTVKEYV